MTKPKETLNVPPQSSSQKQDDDLPGVTADPRTEKMARLLMLAAAATALAITAGAYIYSLSKNPHQKDEKKQEQQLKRNIAAEEKDPPADYSGNQGYYFGDRPNSRNGLHTK